MFRELWYSSKNKKKFIGTKSYELVWWDQLCVHGSFLASRVEINKGEICALCNHTRGSRWSEEEFKLVIKQKGFKLKGKLPKTTKDKFEYTCYCGTENCRESISKFLIGHTDCKKCIKEKIQKINLDKYGNVCSLHGEEVKEKVKQTFLDRYGGMKV